MIRSMINPVPPAQSPETPTPPPQEQQKTPEQEAMEQVQKTQMQQVERGAVSASVGQPGSSQPPPKQVQDQQQTQQQQPDLAQTFAQLTSTGYKPSNQALQDTADKAHSGDVELSATWLANLFIKVLRANSE